MHSRAATDSSAQRSSPDKPTAFPRHLRRSSSLLALESLIAPSPTLTTSDTLCSVRSGEIPIILSFLATNSTDSVKLQDDTSGSQTSLCPGLKPGVKELARFSPMAAFFPMSSAPRSADTAALGSNLSDEANANRNSASTLFPSDSLININFGPCSPFEHHLDLTLSPSCSLLAQINGSKESQGTSSDGILGDESEPTMAAYFVSQSVLGDIPGGLASSKSEQVLSSTSRNDRKRKGEALQNDDCMQSSISFTITEPLEDTGSKSSCLMASRSLSTIHFSAPSPHASTTFSPSPSTPLFTPPLTPLSADRTPTQATFLQRSAALRVKASSAHSRGNSAGPPNVDLSTPILALRPPRTADFKDQESDRVVSSKASKPRLSAEPVSPSDLSPSMPCLKHAQWLKDCIVELWIDQEGFRAIRPKFYLASISNGLPFGQERRSSMRKEDPLFSTVAEFLPVTRDEHLFHYAALDRPPALHRITVNGDEERDFVTRQATLGLKENGVFYVQGTEDYKMNAPPGSGASRIVRLTWRFEYFVSSRRHGPRGKKIAQGEKVFKPLSFSCTPAFLSPNRAIKVNVLHVMKKTLLPNLIAQKLDPPDLPVPPGSVPAALSSESLVSIVVSEPQSPFSESSPLTATPARIRAALENKKTEMNFTHTTPIIGLPPRKSSLRKNRHTNESHSDANLLITQEPEPISHKRHRTQSESEKRGMTDLFASKTMSQARAANLVKPIIARKELSDVFASRDIRGRHSISVGVVDNVQITVLPPAPRPRPSGF